MTPRRALTILRNGLLPTARPVGATAIAIRGDRLLAVGSDSDVGAADRGSATVVDLRGRTVLPGFTDSHTHWATYALAREHLEISADDSLPEALAKVRARASGTPPGQWVQGRGWDHSAWGRWPSAADLDTAAPDKPVALVRKDGHAVWVNSAAMAAAGVTPYTPDPPGGRVARAGGRPTGILQEAAIRLVLDAVPSADAPTRRRAMARAWSDAWRCGIVACHDMGHRAGIALLGDLAALRECGELGLRVVCYVDVEWLEDAVRMGLRSGSGDDWVRMGGIKVYLDGSLGSQTAHMLAPYDGQPDNAGVATLDDAQFRAAVMAGASAGLATAVHAIGDRANRRALDAFAWLRQQALPIADGSHTLRHRIEHAQCVQPEDTGRFGALGVVASMQPIHATSDMRIADRFWGERAAHSYAWRDLIDAGARLAFGSDAPIETCNVLAGIAAAVTRATPSGEPSAGWYPNQRITVSEAVSAYTEGAAWASARERVRGRLAPGYLADLVVLDRDLHAVPSDEIASVKVIATMIGGGWVWQAPDAEIAGPWAEGTGR